jgi:hypothetical protein
VKVREASCLARPAARSDTRTLSFAGTGMKYYLAIIVAIIAAVALSQLMFEFYQWDRQQSCATGGGRNCGGARIQLNQ